MAKNRLTAQSENFAQWYLDVIKVAELADYSKVKGCMVIKPWGYAIWEHIQRGIDERIKSAGVDNVYFPLFIPESFITREKEHIEGFAPECAVVTHGGGKKLAENLFVRPTSETIIYDTFSDWVHSYRDLPLRVNQWANVVRWEMRTRPFLRTTEFLWQEGHTAHATKECADKEAERALAMYVDFDEKCLAMPVMTGKKSRKETFAGALYTLTTEALAKDGKAIQAGTSHNLGQGFAKSFNIQFTDAEGQQQHAWQTSWGVSTRLVGTLIVVHGDDNGLRLPPAVAPVQVVGIPIFKDEAQQKQVAAAFDDLEKELSGMNWNDKSIRFKADMRDTVSPGFKFNEWEVKGVPIRIEIGPRDLENGSCMVVRRDTGEKNTVALSDVASMIPTLLTEIHDELYAQAKQFQEENIHDVSSMDELHDKLEDGGFFRAPWCGDDACEVKIQETTKATIRIVEEEPYTEGTCLCGSQSAHHALFAKAY